MDKSDKIKNSKSKRVLKWTLWLGAIVVLIALLLFKIDEMPSAEVTVIDSQTKEPLKGVVILAYWDSILGCSGSSWPMGITDVTEMVTDKAGKAGYPGWKRLSLRGFCYLFGDTPVAGLYKQGYSDRVTQDNPSAYFVLRDGAVIEMDRYENFPEKFYIDSHFRKVYSEIRDKKQFDCDWDEIPHSILARQQISILTRMDENRESNEGSESWDLDQVKANLEKSLKKTFSRLEECVTYEEIKEKYL